MKELIKGGNALLATSGKVRIAIGWKATPCDLDTVCFAVTNSGKVLADEWFLFYGQLSSPDGSVELQRPTPDKAEFIINLDSLPRSIDRCVFAGVLDGTGLFEQVRGATIGAVATSGEQLTYRIAEPFPGKALIFAELYRHNSGWKFRAVGQGFTGGLHPLAESFGVNIADNAAPPSSPRPAVPPPPPPRPAAPPPPSADNQPPRRNTPPSPPPARHRRRWPWVVAVLVLLLAGSGTAAWLAPKQFFSLLGLSSSSTTSRPPKPITPTPSSSSTTTPTPSATPTVQAVCNFRDDEVYQRYATVNDVFKKVSGTIDNSNNQYARLKRAALEPNFTCTAEIRDISQREIGRLQQLSLDSLSQQVNDLNTCAGLMNKKVEERLDAEKTNMILLNSLFREVDRSRNLESSLTKIARDLGYFKKTANDILVRGYQEILIACDNY